MWPSRPVVEGSASFRVAEITRHIYPKFLANASLRIHKIGVVSLVKRWITRQRVFMIGASELVQNSPDREIHVEDEKRPDLRGQLQR